MLNLPFQKKLGQVHVYHCITSPFLLTALSKHFGTDDEFEILSIQFM